MRRLFAILGLLALAAPLPAAPTVSTTLYDIEVVVFENSQPGLEGGEAWKELRKELGDIEQTATPEGAPAPDSVLSQAAGALERGGQHRILVHKRWQQNADAKSATTPLRLQSANNELDGTLRFYLSRFLHVELNLALQDPRHGRRKGLSNSTNIGGYGHRRFTTSITPGSGRWCASRRSASPKRHSPRSGSSLRDKRDRAFQQQAHARHAGFEVLSISLRLIGPVALPAAGFTTTATEA